MHLITNLKDFTGGKYMFMGLIYHKHIFFMTNEGKINVPPTDARLSLHVRMRKRYAFNPFCLYIVSDEM